MVATHRRQLDEATTRWADGHRVRARRHAGDDRVHRRAAAGGLAARRAATRSSARRGGSHAQEERQRLESVVEERTAELSELSNHLQVVREEEKSKLARDIHDELGGILVSAKMDVAWVEKRVQTARRGGRGEARARAAGARRRRADQAAHHRGTAPDAARQPRPVGRARLAGARDLRSRRAEVHDRDAAGRERDPAERVDRDLPDRAGGADEHRQVRAGKERQRRPPDERRHADAAHRGRRRRHLAEARRATTCRTASPACASACARCTASSRSPAAPRAAR